MRKELREAYNAEMTEAKRLYRARDYESCLSHLERAHILGQRNYIPHVVNHYWMLKAGWRKGDWREVRGQIVRIVGSAGSLVGAVPLGNTGRANVSPIKPMPIPDDLARYFR
ncbi:DUF3703 domain-containing protein [Parvibaculum sp.]|jgi:hypothetical protein|uniref:DUF3703 domain-containing protein n=1 Tax=Parvibaculum sp. TaxID=2024848 RepID=UPI001B208B30|nr:DUF3703 domain-containing protein [Parvibaculum sp.]MBO6635995.1 DUF3703 domain-containing protein [Parvibaculum sp.]MBO6678546.1 DUF3703 domain-containing protein [Parvibaculum sp.]MBO6686528.1 DUF3703 domain-containing protein [Parvibaculum sp.]MBO6903739.1 DUF3703 domain-containing protein [Parvibaculum sp.]